MPIRFTFWSHGRAQQWWWLTSRGITGTVARQSLSCQAIPIFAWQSKYLPRNQIFARQSLSCQAIPIFAWQSKYLPCNQNICQIITIVARKSKYLPGNHNSCLAITIIVSQFAVEWNSAYFCSHENRRWGNLFFITFSIFLRAFKLKHVSPFCTFSWK